jgi:hypothetical protein
VCAHAHENRSIEEINRNALHGIQQKKSSKLKKTLGGLTQLASGFAPHIIL